MLDSEFYTVECIFCCISIKNVALYSGMRLGYLASFLSFRDLLLHVLLEQVQGSLEF